MTKRLAIIGSGSSGLVSLKNAIETLPDWEIVCLERSNSIRGCWGDPHSGFVSTSTKYTTQFACFTKYAANVDPDGRDRRAEFFHDREYGDYLESFADAFGLRERIRLRCRVSRLCRNETDGRWHLTWTDEASSNPSECTEAFDAVILATGLAMKAKQIASEIHTMSIADLRLDDQIDAVTGKRIVVFGGGESAVDAARRLAQPRLENEVFLSLRSGIRVSPRYHPIRGVPSDFLRNRLMLSIHPDLRNWIGQRFVAARIRYQRWFERVFPSRSSPHSDGDHAAANGLSEEDFQTRRSQWAIQLTQQAKSNLFDMFHNKSDDFLDEVARGKITIVGPSVDESQRRFEPFGDSTSDERPIMVAPEMIVPAIGYRSGVSELTDGKIAPQDFYQGCCHATHANLFLIGFARPVIGNIPTISEMQARYVCGLIAGRWQRPADVESLHLQELAGLKKRFALLDLNAVYPVEMFPYCDELAKRMKAYPSFWSLRSLRAWWRIQLEPATTLHYQCWKDNAPHDADDSTIYLPSILIALLLMLKPVDAIYRLVKRI